MGGKASKNVGGEAALAAVDALRKNNAVECLVLTGPINGKVTDTTAIILLEVDENIQIVCKATSFTGHTVTAAVNFKSRAPSCFVLEGLNPSTSYTYTFTRGVEIGQLSLVDSLGCGFRTLPQNVQKLRVVAMSCDRPRRLLDGEPNPYDTLATEADEVDVMLHLGDQVYTCMDGFLDRALLWSDSYANSLTSDSVKHKMLNYSMEELRNCYRYTWSLPSCRQVMAKSQHLMIWSDNDVANDFTEMEEFPKHFVQAGMGVYREYQRKLWDPLATPIISADGMGGKVEEWHFHRYGRVGIFMVDMRGNRLRPDGSVEPANALMGDKQWGELQAAFESPDLACMIVASEIPFVTSSPADAKADSVKIPFLTGHWAYHEAETSALFDLCFGWKAAVPGREVLLLGGDVHVGSRTVLTDKTSGATILSYVASPITNHVCAFFNKPEDDFNDRYHFKHEPLLNKRNYCTIDIAFDDEGNCTVESKLVGFSSSGK